VTRSRKRRRTPGDVFKVALDQERAAFGLVLDEPLVAFFDLTRSAADVPGVEEIVASPIAFRIWVVNRPLIDGTWPIVGHVTVPSSLRERPWFFKQDPMSTKLSVLRTGAEEIEATPEQVAGLERAAVWDPRHVVDRLTDHFERRPNKWVESMKKLRP
jgi:hypothetical protein